jgi:hypothetical protein
MSSSAASAIDPSIVTGVADLSSLPGLFEVAVTGALPGTSISVSADPVHPWFLGQVAGGGG